MKRHSLSTFVLFSVVIVSVALVLIMLFLREAEISASDFPRTRNVIAFVGLVVAALVILTAFVIIGFIRSTSKVEEKEEEIRAIISNLTDGIIVYGEDNAIYLMNPIAEEILGVEAQSILGKKIARDYKSAFDPFSNLQTLFFAAAVKEPSYEMLSHVPIGRKGGEIRMGEVNINKPLLRNLVIIEVPLSLPAQRDSRARFMKIIRDVTRERSLSKIKSDFINIAGHQMRTPLSGLKWTLKMLLDGDLGPLSDEQKQFIQRGYGSNERMIRLVGDLLDVSRIEDGRFGYQFQEGDFNSLLKKILYEFEPRFRDKKLKIEVEKPEHEFRFFFDPKRLQMVIENFLENALAYTLDGGQILIRVSEEPSYMVFSVKDTGIGIPERQHNLIFTKFFRGNNAVRMQTEGSGLGLFISKNIIAAHGGSVWFESKENQGTTMFFKIPMKKEMLPKEERHIAEFISRL